MKLTPALLAHFADNYLDFLDLHRAGIINYATACEWSVQIWFYIHATYYSKAKAA